MKRQILSGSKTLTKQLEEIIREKIASREWHVHEAIPSEHQLSETYSISRSTVRAVLLRLEKDGLIYRKQGKGTFVAPPSEGLSFAGNWLGLRDKLDTQLPTPVARVVAAGLIPASELVADMLDVKPGNMVYEIIRARYRMIPDSMPCMIQYSYMSPEIGQHIETDKLILSRLTQQIYEKNGLSPFKLKEWIQASIASPFEAYELGVGAGAPVLLADELSFSQAEKPYLFTRFAVVSHVIRLSFN